MGGWGVILQWLHERQRQHRKDHAGGCFGKRLGGGGGVICQMAAWDCADLQMGPAGLHTSALGTQPPRWPLGREESWGQCLDLSSVSSLGGEEQGCRSLGNDQ